MRASNQGHRATAERRASGSNAYTVTDPRLGGLRTEQRADQGQTFLQRLLLQRPVKVCPVYRLYSDTAPLESNRRFQVLPLHSYADADIVVLDRLSDVDTKRNHELVASLNSCYSARSAAHRACRVCSVTRFKAAALILVYGFGKILATRDTVQAYMENPCAANEQSFLCFDAAATSKLVGVEVAFQFRQLLGCQ